MPSGYKRQHLRIDHFAELKPYKRPNRVVPPRDRGYETEQHAEALKKELASAWAASNELLEARDPDIAGTAGRYLDFETLPDAPVPDLTWSRKGIRLASAARTRSGEVEGTLFVPDEAQNFLVEKLEEYKLQRGKSGPSHAPRFASIEHFRAARLESLWVDTRPIPEPDAVDWWECWCWPDRIANLEAKANAANVLIGEGRLRFAEREVLFLHTDRTTIARIVASTDAIAELRLGRDDAYFFTNDKARDDQHGWVADAASRIALSENREAVAVCLLDTGINRAHPLLAPLIDADDLHSLHPDWGVSDHHGHGSEMSGLAFYGDLTTCFASINPIPINYVGEGVKLLAPPGFNPTQPQRYGLATRQAILRPEIAKPLRERVFCMAVTQNNVFGPKPTSWSASLDATAFGGDDFDDLRQRLICVSAGNLPDGLPLDDLKHWDSYEIEDPAHAWNVLTVGGYTQKGPITDHGFTHWSCAVELGTFSPYSRVSAAWARGVSPIKPELVLEAGNKGVDSADQNMVSGIDSLSLLTTSRDPIGQPLTLSWATSAATAQLSGMAATVGPVQPVANTLSLHG